MNIDSICGPLRSAAAALAVRTAAQKNRALAAAASSIQKNRGAILAANAEDIRAAHAAGTSASLIERLMLDDARIDGILKSMETVIAQTDPIGEETAGWKTPAGMTIRQVRVPLGVAAIIYESRPNVTADAFCLAYKSGNAILLRGSSSAVRSNRAIVAAIKEGLSSDGADGIPEAVALVEPEPSHEDVRQILSAAGKIDVVLPRGGAKLIQNVVENAKVPVIETGSGVCHLYVDESADLEMAARIAENAKLQRPSVCNAIECILVHKAACAQFLPLLEARFGGRAELHADGTCFPILAEAAANAAPRNTRYGRNCVVRAEERDFGCEFLDFACTVKAVASLDEAVSYINAHNTRHSESIITESRSAARKFQAEVDAACVYVNCSTRFTDGGEFGFGAELGISTQKLHARGPMGIRALTTTKYLIDGDGQTR
ncbi:MAG: glutamate-5-semialdehyde dehydrogenase [Treponemataceae bacterium]|nr:glutamate-5-semialdehyde dehydrogenase [Treponemataceae bacterium]